VTAAPSPPLSQRDALLAFVIVALIWGSTWLVIKDQVAVVPPAWSVTWRFAIACAAMFVLAGLRRDRLRLPRAVWPIAVAVGLLQFCVNFQLVYAAEIHLTSGLVAVFYALLMVPNALLGRAFLDTPIGGRFLLGSAIAIAGIALLLAHEYRVAPVGGSILLGTALAFGGVMAASVANVLQATRRVSNVPVVSLLAWAMLWGTLANAAFAALTVGAPTLDPRTQYLAGIVYLAIIGSVAAFPLYFRLIRTWGAGKAAYNGVAVPVVAMALSTLFEGYRWSTLAVAGSVLAMIGLLVALSRNIESNPKA
jgi:drug/metabolite transporter (DMT)-like permease